MDNRLEQLQELTGLFEANSGQYKSPQYDEANTRTDFIDKFFALLDWDIANNQGFSETYREVVREDKVKIDGGQKAPDYSFRIGGIRKYFVEAKKPSVNIKDAADPAFQVRRYAYTAKLPLSILTNFAEFAVYDTRIKPNKNDTAGTARIFYCAFQDYQKNFDFIYNTFSRPSILKGSFDKYVEDNKNKKGTSEVDAELLNLVEGWRVDLAKNIAMRNPALSIYNLNAAVQKIIDRIIFLRIAEDRGMEYANILKTIAKVTDIYEKFNLLVEKANVKYNSGLFESEDWLTHISIDDKILKDIIDNLYYPECPYEFSVLPIEILGNIYEKFLGKTIRFRNVKNTHTAVVEEKPEVRKSGGVFYTPQFIVRFIIKNTVEEKIKNKTPDEISHLKICDPACGSGSMLVGAYQCLLSYHLDYYTDEKNKNRSLKKGYIFQVSENMYRLTIAEKQRILQNNIFGVDIDSQAVEVTKLSLYLKLLENEGKEAEGQLFNFSDMTLLPSLEENIKCGNSLVGTDFYNQKTLGLTEDEQIKVNCFDWEKEFDGIMKGGGFDIIIGNPPYYNVQTLGANSEIASYLQETYSRIWQDKSDILFYFLARALQLSKDAIGFILSNAFLFSDKAQKLRNAILDDGRLAKIVNFEQFRVFKDASITSGVFIFRKGHKNIQTAVLKEKSCTVDYVVDYMNNKKNYFPVSFSKNKVFALVDTVIETLNKKIDARHPVLQDLLLLGKGMETAADDVFLFDHKPSQFPPEYIKGRVTGRNIERYLIKPAEEYILYFEDVEDLNDLPASIQEHLKKHKKRLSNRADKKRRPAAQWWNYTFAMHKEYYHLPKLYCSRRAFRNTFCYDEGFNYLGFSNMTVLFETNKKYSIKYILALLNSKLLDFRYKSMGKQTGGGSFEYFPNGIGKLPIPEADAKTQGEFAILVDKMLELKQREYAEKIPQA
ncbi:MAG: N-6 DNA methylase, partial [Spirochaetaceae bacterium]|nr:N-6 DNA methylase [Spirochaetaceae bacterium]